MIKKIYLVKITTSGEKMKKILVAAIGFILLASVVHAETQGSSASTKAKNPLIEKTQGKINAISKADQSKGSLGGFEVVADGGKTKEFTLIAKTRFFSAASAPATFADLKKGDKVTVLSVVTLKGDNDVITVTQNK